MQRTVIIFLYFQTIDNFNHRLPHTHTNIFLNHKISIEIPLCRGFSTSGVDCVGFSVSVELWLIGSD